MSIKIQDLKVIPQKTLLKPEYNSQKNTVPSTYFPSLSETTQTTAPAVDLSPRLINEGEGDFQRSWPQAA